MFCILCRKHDVSNLQNKSKKFNSEPAVRFKLKSVEEHSISQHEAAVNAFDSTRYPHQIWLYQCHRWRI